MGPSLIFLVWRQSAAATPTELRKHKPGLPEREGGWWLVAEQTQAETRFRHRGLAWYQDPVNCPLS